MKKKFKRQGRKHNHYWNIYVEGDRVYTEWGIVGTSNPQTNSEQVFGMNVGKSNEITPEQQAVLVMERKILNKMEEGFVDEEEGTLKGVNNTISFTEKLPKNLCFYKPKNSIKPSKIIKLENKKKLICTVKRDGMMHIVRKTDKFGVEIYTRRMDDVTNKFPHLVSAFNILPCNTILLGEIIFINNDNTDNFQFVSQVCRSNVDKAVIKQKENQWLTYYIFDVAFYKGEDLLHSKTYKERIKYIPSSLNSSYIKRVEEVHKSHEFAMQEIKNRKLEGLVLWDSESIIKVGNGYSFNGTAYRPNVVFKSKPKYENDFIVRYDPENNIGERGAGKHEGMLGSVYLYRVVDGKEEFVCKCGGGLSEDQRKRYNDPSLFPRVWEIEYDSLTPDKALRFPVFKRDRTDVGDKTIKEVFK